MYTGGYNRVAAELNIEAVPSMPALLLGDLTLVTEVPQVLGIPLEKMNEWRPAQAAAYRKNLRVRYTGPIYAELNLPVPAHVDAFLKGLRPIVYVAITSSSATLVREVVRQVATVGVRVLVAGTVHSLQDLANERVMVEGVLPSQLIMPRVDLAVTAGGQGSVQCAMASGTPLLGILLQPEQDLNVDLLAKQGAAQLVSKKDAVTPKLGRAVMKIIATPQFAENARRIQGIYRQVDGPGACADAILEFINLRPASATRSATLTAAAGTA